MSSIRFNLRDSKTPTKAVPVYIIIEHKGKRIMKYTNTGVKVVYNNWSLENQLCTKKHENYNRINEKILQLKKIVIKAFADIEARNEVLTKEVLENVLNGTTNKNKAHDGTVISFMEKHISELPNQINPQTNRPLARETIAKYVCLKKNLLEMQKLKNKTFTFQNIDMPFYHSFIQYLNSKNLQPNTIGFKFVKTLKVILSEAERQGITVNNAYKSKKFVAPSQEVRHEYLNSKEIEILENLELPKDTMIDKVRDLFLVGYYSGQRFGDYSIITKDNFEQNGDGNWNLKLKQNKTGTFVTVPIDGKCIDLMEKYNWELKKISAQYFRKCIKKLCELAGFDSEISDTKNYGGRDEVIKQPKYMLITSHTTRRSFATNYFLTNKLAVINIMRLTGHKTEKEFMKYLCFSDAENSEIVRNINVEKPQNGLQIVKKAVGM